MHALKEILQGLISDYDEDAVCLKPFISFHYDYILLNKVPTKSIFLKYSLLVTFLPISQF